MSKTSFINRAKEPVHGHSQSPLFTDFMYACAGDLHSHTTSFQVRKLGAVSVVDFDLAELGPRCRWSRHLHHAGAGFAHTVPKCAPDRWRWLLTRLRSY